ncbi:MAG: FHA domain-containing protein [Planctomycetes bacterium]|nr:FHA domain-containing protein [Planctomycetota bacterium]
MPLWLAMRGADPFLLQPGRDVTIGRGRKCDLSLYSTQLSREHARIRWEHEGPVLFDLDSLNGCYVGVDRVLRHSLTPGDAIRLGDITLLVVESEGPPRPLQQGEDPPTEVSRVQSDELEITPSSLETQILHRQAPVHEQLFAWREIEWLLDQTSAAEMAALHDECFSSDDLTAWGKQYGFPGLYRFLSLGVLVPRDPASELDHAAPATLASGLTISPRGDKLRRHREGDRITWNEMAHLRHRVRQAVLYPALREVARAYRPGCGLDDFKCEDLVYEVHKIYAVEVPAAQRALGLRRLLCLGILAPRPGTDASAWYPTDDWSQKPLSVGLSLRGRAVLEGFRIEDST